MTQSNSIRFIAAVYASVIKSYAIAVVASTANEKRTYMLVCFLL